MYNTVFNIIIIIITAALECHRKTPKFSKIFSRTEGRSVRASEEVGFDADAGREEASLRSDISE